MQLAAFLVIEKRTFFIGKMAPTAKFRAYGTQLRDKRYPNLGTFRKDYVGCAECHSPLLWENEWSNGRLHVFLGTLEKDQKEELNKVSHFRYAYGARNYANPFYFSFPDTDPISYLHFEQTRYHNNCW